MEIFKIKETCCFRLKDVSRQKDASVHLCKRVKSNTKQREELLLSHSKHGYLQHAAAAADHRHPMHSSRGRGQGVAGTTALPAPPAIPQSSSKVLSWSSKMAH